MSDGEAASPKRPFDIEAALELIAEAIHVHPQAALFTLMEEGHKSLFEILVACIISIRTLDEVMLPTARRLLAIAKTPADMAQLTAEQIDTAISACAFHAAKAQQIHAIAVQTTQEYGADIPCDREVLLSFAGVGPKCANLSLGTACGQPFIGVDIHVHRVSNRWGYVQTKTPEQTLLALEAKVPQERWLDINRLIMPFGKFICNSPRPRCSTCPLLPMCPQIGVTKWR